MNITGKLERLDPHHSDFLKVLKLDQEQFPKPWSDKDWVNLNWNHYILFGWYFENSLVGLVLLANIPSDDSAHLLKICIHVDLRGRGVSLEFWDACLKVIQNHGIKSLFLEVEAHNQRAIGFYRKVGFESLRTIKGYYSDGSDALTMQMTL